MRCWTEIPRCNFMARSMSDHLARNVEMKLRRYAIHKTELLKMLLNIGENRSGNVPLFYPV